MNSIAFIDAKVFNPRTGELEQQNILLKNGVWLGAGYLPDDDQGTEIFSVKGCIIVPNVVDVTPTLSPSDVADYTEIQPAIGITSTVFSSDLLATQPPYTYAPIEDLLYSSKSEVLMDAVQNGQIELVSSQRFWATPWVSALIHRWHVDQKRPLAELLQVLSSRPKHIFGLDLPKWGLLSKPSFSIFDLQRSVTFTPPSQNEVKFATLEVSGRCICSLRLGQIVHRDSEFNSTSR